MLDQVRYNDYKTIVKLVREIAGDELSNSQVQHLAQQISLAFLDGKLAGVRELKEVLIPEKKND